jgi:hypothetical protein
MHIYIIYPWVLLVQDRVIALLRFDDNVGNLSLLTTGGYYDHKSQNKIGKRKWWPGRDVVWVFVGVTGGVPWPRGIAWLHYFPCPRRLRTVRCIDPGQVTDLLSRAHTCLWEREGLLLSYHGLRLFPDRLIGGGDRWRFKHCIEVRPQVWGLESKFGREPVTLWHEWNGLVSLVLGVQARRVFSRYPAGHINSWIAVSAWRYGLTTLWHRSKKWQRKDEKIALIAQPLLDYRTGAYIECWVTTKTRLLKIYRIKDTLLVLLFANKELTSHKAYHNSWESINIFPVR